MSEINDIIQAFKKHKLNIEIRSFLYSSDVYIFDIKILIEIAFYVLELKFLPFHHLCFYQSLISLIFYVKNKTRFIISLIIEP